MKVWLDDCRPLPEKYLGSNWVWVRTVEEAITLLETGLVEIIDLDNDLDFAFFTATNNEPGTYLREGREVIDWICAKIFRENWNPPDKIHVHTENPSAKKYMHSAIRKIAEYMQQSKSIAWMQY